MKDNLAAIRKFNLQKAVSKARENIVAQVIRSDPLVIFPSISLMIFMVWPCMQFESVTAQKEKETRKKARRLEEAFPAFGLGSPFEPFEVELSNVFINYSVRSNQLMGLDWITFCKEALASRKPEKGILHHDIRMVQLELQPGPLIGDSTSSGSATQAVLRVLDYSRFIEALAR